MYNQGMRSNPMYNQQTAHTRDSRLGYGSIGPLSAGLLGAGLGYLGEELFDNDVPAGVAPGGYGGYPGPSGYGAYGYSGANYGGYGGYNNYPGNRPGLF
ncbi:hypothetical protein CR203_04240 [Salipaludibacillus neizhouensis]|uniref:Uncharacterized protein n=1 Tax=Salipaludibacillus neizhouensis TaxID=885475 RepID=A0A3A9KMV4_9BACI|nr:hypothetical protein [Salipaludibacillus neizhouensis]RKL69245.1 hypothetical protein CR203_04240 [Salipaludibacillus neizhouensis]